MEPSSSQEEVEWDESDLGIKQHAEEEEKFVPAPTYSVLRMEEVLERLKKLLQDCQDLLSVTPDEALFILIHFKWAWHKLQSDWFGHETEIRRSCGLELEPGVEPIKGCEGICAVCGEQINKENSDALACGHTLCKSCWTGYLEVQLLKGKSCAFTFCPFSGCKLRVVFSMFKKYLSKMNFTKYNKFLVMLFTDDSQSLKWCPKKGCTYIIENTGPALTEVTCKCGYMFCFNCLEESHEPASCAKLKSWNDRSMSEGANLKWIKAYTKECPGCHTRIEKNQGCNHMTCGNCRHQFCWICLGNWKTHGGYSCNRINKELVDTSSAAKNELQKYIFYLERYENHKNAISHIDRIKYDIYDFVANISVLKGISMDDLTFLQTAIDTIKVILRILSNSYVIGYYLKSVKEVALFEFIQKDLEHNCGRLQEMLEREKQSFLDVDDLSNSAFFTYKSEVNNLCSALKKVSTNNPSVIMRSSTASSLRT